MKSAMQLKAKIRNLSKDKNISPQIILQNYMLERFLERLSKSKYNNNFVLKGGFLIASIIGIESRTTMDMDFTMKKYPLNKESITSIIKEICDCVNIDNIKFVIEDINEIRKDEEYTGYRVSIFAIYENVKTLLKLDITTGDIITPNEITYSYKLMFEDRVINVLTYNLATILAEKMETILSRGIENTRLRDFYDVYILYKTQNNNISITELKDALITTSKIRGSFNHLKDYYDIITNIKNDETMNNRWINYNRNNNHTSNIDFIELCNLLIMIMEKIDKLV